MSEPRLEVKRVRALAPRWWREPRAWLARRNLERAYRRERAALTARERELLDSIDLELERRVIYGDADDSAGA